MKNGWGGGVQKPFGNRNLRKRILEIECTVFIISGC